MKTLKNKSTVLLVLILATALLLSACGTAAILASQDSESTADLTSANSGSAVNYAALSAEGSQSSAQSVSSSDTFSEAFSNRDLSGDYDTAEAVTISLNGTSASASSASVQISGGTVTITAAGTYILSGTLDNGSIIVNATKDDKIQLVLDGVTIRSETFAAIYVVQADKVFVTLAESSVNTLTNGGSFVQSDDNDVDAVIFAKDDLETMEEAENQSWRTAKTWRTSGKSLCSGKNAQGLLACGCDTLCTRRALNTSARKGGTGECP